MTLAAWTTMTALALALAADAFAVALCQGAASRPGWRGAARIGLAFGAAQGLMPLAGWAAGLAFASAIAEVDHWVAFALLAALGLKSLREGLSREEGDCAPISGWALFGAAMATSIDAAAAGITLPAMGAPILAACAVIGAVTLATSTGGVLLGAAAGTRLGKPAEIAAGLALIAIGTKILAEHLWAGA